MTREGQTQVTIRTTESFWDEVRDLAQAHECTVVELVNEIMQEYVDEGGSPQPETEPLIRRVIRVNDKLFARARRIADRSNENLSEVVRARLAGRLVRSAPGTAR